ncbi:dTDP-glucose 4,6-dehydratase [Paenibacillus flagellatus]|uniref:dTDP-glucose 4,6-dehydratase n=1 Tax=Paenibacillus flagellatus TaxID=2211139 RepID=A0A2V5JYX2_9BACL|nr:dTDP-glucose 4,6-dehydratase [Paenibacillus flagellatus]PYI52105.1 dTDP-glucose 4,6-dehydratase [Paenibacillus flagellatus]
MSRTIWVTGGMGFIGSNFILHMLREHPDYTIVNYDALTYAGDPDNVREAEPNPRYRFVRGDITDAEAVEDAMEGADAVVHFAAESHVDRSIADPAAFVRTNVLGTQMLLEAARRLGVRRFVHVSTDEVYGTLGATGLFSETTPLAPNSPYSASKAGSDLLVRAYYHTYGMDVVTTRCSNNYGPRQHPEKLIPLVITRALRNLPIPVYGNGLNVRDWLYVEDHCRAVDLVLHQGRAGEVYNIGGGNELTNLEVVRRILDELGKPHSLIEMVQDRPGHDLRYAIDASKLASELGWRPAHTFEQGLRHTLDWYRQRTARGRSDPDGADRPRQHDTEG